MSGSIATYKSGLLAEHICAWILRLKGYRILQTRYRTPAGEIDLIVKRGKTLAFVEVKARKDKSIGLQALLSKQQKRIEKASHYYVSERKCHSIKSIRFDVMVTSPWKWPIHLMDAWRPGGGYY